ncbi:MAG: dephospho-CoA kinase [Acidobacteria bacterium]|nr:dephospho-CoA kinase [Acidobacteriota bacterium]
MLRVALTGGIGTGKTYVRGRFHALGVPTIDADEVVHQALGPGTPVTSCVAERFGVGILAPDGAVDRRKLGAIVFADEDARHALEALVHPAVLQTIATWFATEARTAGRGWALADIPLLFETARHGWFDKVIVAACGPDNQIRRIMARDGVSDAEARARLAAQWPIALKIARADFVVWTDQTFADTDRQVDEFYRVLTTLAPRSL